MNLTHLRNASLALLLVTIAAVGIGCGSRNARAGFEPLPPKPPPTFPAPRDVAIDHALVAAAKEEINALLKSTLPSDRAHAIEAYRMLMPEEASQPIIEGLDGPNQIIRFAAAMAAGDMKLKAAMPRLQAHLADPDPKVQVAVRYALYQLGDVSHIRDLENSAQDFVTPSGTGDKAPPAGSYVRGATAMVLGRMNEPTVGNILRTLRADVSPIVRQQAEEALFLHGDGRARDAIVGLTASQYPDDQMLGLLVLANAKQPQYRNHARARLTSDYPEVALVAARALGEMNADDGYGIAMIGAKSGEPRQRSLAAQAFGAIGRTDSQELVAPLLKDKDSEVRAAAATAILRIAKEPKRYNRSGDLLH